LNLEVEPIGFSYLSPPKNEGFHFYRNDIGTIFLKTRNLSWFAIEKARKQPLFEILKKGSTFL
jgi:hypothetical protein